MKRCKSWPGSETCSWLEADWAAETIDKISAAFLAIWSSARVRRLPRTVLFESRPSSIR